MLERAEAGFNTDKLMNLFSCTMTLKKNIRSKDAGSAVAV